MLPWDFSSTDTPIVYHYTTVSAARAIISTKSIWLSEYSAMNDSSEFTHGRDKLFSLMQKRTVEMDIFARLVATITVDGFTEALGPVIASFSARRDDLSQWRSYADDGQGCVIGVDARFFENEAGVAMRRVIYDEQTVEKLLRAALTVVQEEYSDPSTNIDTVSNAARHVASSLFNLKHPAFADEREIRIARMLLRTDDGDLRDPGGHRSDGSEVPPIPVNVRNSGFGETSYIALPLTRPDGSSAILEVGLGPTMSDSERKSQEDFFSKHGVSIWQSDLPYRK